MCGRCAPHGQCAPGYAGALGIGGREFVYPPGQRAEARTRRQSQRPPALKSSCPARRIGPAVHVRAKGVLRTAGSKRLFRPFLSAQKGARRRSGETNPRQGLPKTGPAPGGGSRPTKNPRHWPMPKIPPPGEGGRGAPPPKKQQHAPVPPQISGTRA